MSDVTSNRQFKVAELIRLALIDVLRKGKGLDARLIDAGVTITNVRITPDLKIANCYVLPFLGNKALAREELLAALESSKYQIRANVTAKVKLKYSPEIRFFYDRGFENASEIDDILKGLD